VNRYDKGISPYGVYQMAGNVSEWVSDWFDPEYYRSSPPDNPTGPAAGELKVFRGGSWNEDPEVARSAGRNAGTLDRKSYLTGLRCARSTTGKGLEAKDEGAEPASPLPLTSRHVARD
jgi:iron(II)-dependent oxidoreductase